jgi:DNA-binding MarR family transcriptional regulator
VTGHATASRRATAAHYDDSRITAVGLLMETVGGLNARLAAQYAEHDLSAVEFEVLLRLARSPEQQLRMTDLATQTMLTTSGITRVIDRLERDGLVERSACPTDRRGSNATITSDGIERLDAVLPGHLDLLEKWFTGQLDKDQLTGLLDGLRIIRDAVRPGATAGANHS